MPAPHHTYSLAEQVLWAGHTYGSHASRDLREHLAQNGLRPFRAETGQVLELGEGRACVSLLPGSAVLLLEWDKFQELKPVGGGTD